LISLGTVYHTKPGAVADVDHHRASPASLQHVVGSSAMVLVVLHQGVDHLVAAAGENTDKERLLAQSRCFSSAFVTTVTTRRSTPW
jgi:hypothetical protein